MEACAAPGLEGAVGVWVYDGEKDDHMASVSESCTRLSNASNGEFYLYPFETTVRGLPNHPLALWKVTPS